MRRLVAFIPALLLAACATVPQRPAARGPVEVQILAINDFHGNLKPPGLSYEGSKGTVPVGGAAYLATALRESRTERSITVAAGDLISASPLISSLFYDEPTIAALSDSGLALAAVGNHEFDRGPDELLRMQNGGCREARPGDTRLSCKLESFRGAGFQYLAANVVGQDGRTLLPATALRDIGGVRIGFIGMTLKETASLVSPDGVRGLAFTDEAATANALVPYLKANGARAIVLLIHQGASITGKFDDQSCPGLSGALLPILDKLDPAVNLVVSGHTHNAYICTVGSRLLTSAGKYGGMITDVRLTFAPDGSLAGARGDFVPVQGEAITSGKAPVALNPAYRQLAADPAVAGLVARYDSAAQETASRPVGTISGELIWKDVGNVSPAALFIADAMFAAAKAPDKGASDFALMNAGGARTGLIPGPGGAITYNQIFTMQPFANNIVTLSLSGRDVLALLEQQFDSGLNTVAKPNLLMPSAGMRFAYDRSRPAGQRIVNVTIADKPLDPARTYRVTVNNFMASGGDNFTVLTRGTNVIDAGLDVDATEAFLKDGASVPAEDRITDLTPKGWKAP